MTRVFSYWEGSRPPWIELCLETLHKNVPAIEVLTPTSWSELWTEDDEQLRDAFDLQRPNVKSDFIRSWLLATIGGVWVDADCIAFRDLRPICQPLNDGGDFVAYRVGQPAPQLCSALIASNSSGAIASKLSEIHREKLSTGKKLHALSLGPNSLVRARKLTGLQFSFIPARLVHQIHWFRREQSTIEFDPELHGELVPKDAYCCMLTHRMLGPLRNAGSDELLTGSSVASAMFRRALNNREY